MFNIGPGELVVILLLALILLGPKRLPDAARAVGKGMREFRRATEDLKGTLEQELGDLQDPLRPTPEPRPAITEGVAVQRSLPASVPAAPPSASPSGSPSAPDDPPVAFPTSEPPKV